MVLRPSSLTWLQCPLSFRHPCLLTVSFLVFCGTSLLADNQLQQVSLDVSLHPTALPLASLDKPNLTYYHNWSDEKGVSHFSQCKFTNWTYHNYLPPSKPLWTDPKQNPTNVLLTQLPVGWDGPWHKDPVPQLVLFLSGTGLWQTMDGTNYTFTAGDVYFGNDQASSKGHYSKNVGSNPVYMVLLQFANYSTEMNRSCWLQ